MAFEPEPDHAAKLLFLLWPHDLRTHFLIGDVVGIRTGFCILVQVRILFLAGIAEQGQPVVKNGDRRDDVAAVNQSVKHQHTADLLGKLRPQLVIVGKAGGNAFPVSSPGHNARRSGPWFPQSAKHNTRSRAPEIQAAPIFGWEE